MQVEARYEGEGQWDDSPIGTEYIDDTRRLEDEFGSLGRELLSSGRAGKNLPILYERTGDALSLLYRFATCAWGCKGGDHIVEDNARRICNFGHSSLTLYMSGYYDESLALVRGIGEVVNLMQLEVAPVEWTGMN